MSKLYCQGPPDGGGSCLGAFMVRFIRFILFSFRFLHWRNLVVKGVLWDLKIDGLPIGQAKNVRSLGFQPLKGQLCYWEHHVPFIVYIGTAPCSDEWLCLVLQLVPFIVLEGGHPLMAYPINVKIHENLYNSCLQYHGSKN